MYEDLKEHVQLTNTNQQLVGQTIAGRFEVLSLIGEGGMSAVYKAKHLLLDQVCVLKVILPSRADEKAIKRFQEEAKATSKLSHENIASLREFGVDSEGRPYLAMEFVEGKTLAAEIKSNGKLSPERVVDIVLQTCAGLEYAHKSGVFHRDIKPDNIMLSRTAAGAESVKIVDFGIAKIFHPDGPQVNLTQTGEVFGTPGYMSPEQCYGRQIDGRSDIYSLGCVMYEALTGKPIAGGESALDAIMQHINGVTLHFDPFIPSALEAIVRKAVAKDVKDRYQSMQEFENDLHAMKAGKFPAVAPARLQKKTPIQVGIGLFGLCILASFLFSTADQISKKKTEPVPASAPPAIVLNVAAPEISVPNAKRPKDGDAAGWFQYAKQAEAGHVEEAIAAYKYVVQLTPSDPDAWYSLGENYLLLNRHKQAENAFTKATSLKPTDARFWLSLGRAQHGMQKDFDAVKSYQQAIKLEPKYTLAWEELANSYYALDLPKDGDDARKQAEKLHGY